MAILPNLFKIYPPPSLGQNAWLKVEPRAKEQAASAPETYLGRHGRMSLVRHPFCF